MLNRIELFDKILVTVAEQYFFFNEDNPDAITQFVEFYRLNSTLIHLIYEVSVFYEY